MLADLGFVLAHLTSHSASAAPIYKGTPLEQRMCGPAGSRQHLRADLRVHDPLLPRIWGSGSGCSGRVLAQNHQQGRCAPRPPRPVFAHFNEGPEDAALVADFER
jgi:hypothetical protein